MKNRSHLKKKIITNKNGHKQTVWVRGEGNKKKKTLKQQADGKCYDLSGRVILNMGDPESDKIRKEIEKHLGKDVELKLVHGVATLRGGPNVGKKFGHSWLETDDMVIDVATGEAKIFPKEVYYAIGGVDKSKKHTYTEEEARKKVIETGNWGSWEKNVNPENEWLK